MHVCAIGSDWGRRQLLFRDYLRDSPAVREEYAALKRKLISRWRDDRKAYTEAKTTFCSSHTQSALWPINIQPWQPRRG